VTKSRSFASFKAYESFIIAISWIFASMALTWDSCGASA